MNSDTPEPGDEKDHLVGLIQELEHENKSLKALVEKVKGLLGKTGYGDEIIDDALQAIEDSEEEKK